MRAHNPILPPLALGAVASACVVAPVVQPAGTRALTLHDLPEGSEVCELAGDDGVTLRGVFVPAGDGAPLILHLLPSQASITSGVAWGGSASGGGVAGLRETLTELRSHGFSSLIVDYRGVGASDGEPDPRRLGDDAQVMWSEALRRTGGRAGQVVLRAASVGCLAAAALLDEGARPAGVVLFAPVRAETIAGHAARERKGAFLGALIAPFLTRPLDVDLVEMLARTPVDTLVLLPTEDVYLPTQEARRIEQAAARGEGRRVVRLPGSHHAAVLRAWGFSVDEQRFAGRLTPDLLAVEQELLERLLSRANP